MCVQRPANNTRYGLIYWPTHSSIAWFSNSSHSDHLLYLTITIPLGSAWFAENTIWQNHEKDIRKIAASQYDELGDVSTLANPSIVEEIKVKHMSMTEEQ